MAAEARATSSTVPFDDFVPQADASIRTVTWQGYYCNVAFTGSAIPEPVASAFRIKLARDDFDGQRPPFETFWTTESTATTRVETLPVAAVRQELEFTRMDAPCAARNSGDPAAYYRFSADLSASYEVRAGTRYWIGIQAVMPSMPVAWHWRIGLQDNSFSIYWLGVLTTFFADRAFALQATSP